MDNNTAHDVWHNKYMNDIRRDMLEGRFIKGCEKCYNQEQNTGNSDRLEKWNKSKYMDVVKKNEYKPVAYPTHIEHRPGNLNVACAMKNIVTYGEKKLKDIGTTNTQIKHKDG